MAPARSVKLTIGADARSTDAKAYFGVSHSERKSENSAILWKGG